MLRQAQVQRELRHAGQGILCTVQHGASGALVDRATVFEGIENAGAGLEGLLNGANLGKALIRLSD